MGRSTGLLKRDEEAATHAMPSVDLEMAMDLLRKKSQVGVGLSSSKTQEMEISRSTVLKTTYTMFALVLAAFTMRYDADKRSKFEDMRRCWKVLLKREWI